MGENDFAVIGGGLVGVAVAFRASRGNIGLVRVQCKGVNIPGYACWTRLLAEYYP